MISVKSEAVISEAHLYSYCGNDLHTVKQCSSLYILIEQVSFILSGCWKHPLLARDAVYTCKFV